jgi:hypothetical protein
VATRGTGQDLMTLLHARQNHGAEPFYSYLDGNNQIVTRSYVCTVTIGRDDDGPRAFEDCAGVGDSFINSYTMAPEYDLILSSHQHIGPISGSYGSAARQGDDGSHCFLLT